jgi:ubiquinone/menaquinone biosynthesis C-methylase UbiE
MTIGQARRSRVMRERWNSGNNATDRYKARIAELAHPGSAILHAGCGWDKKDVSGPYRHLCRVVGVDADPSVATRFHSEFHLADLADIPLEDASFDLVLCEYTVEHLPDPLAALSEMGRVLKPGGRILALTPNLGSYKVAAAAVTPHSFHLAMGRIRYGAGQDADMYPTLYKCNTPGAFRRLARQAGLTILSTELVTNGPTWFERFPVAFGVFDLMHRAMERWEALRWLRCALIVELTRPPQPGPQYTTADRPTGTRNPASP